MIKTLVNLLQSDLDSPGRKTAAFALFGLISGHPQQENTVIKELQVMQKDPQLHWRIAAERVLEMMRIQDLVRDALKNRGREDAIKLQLENLAATESEEHIRFVSMLILAEIDDADMKKQGSAPAPLP
jgi:hypothetical protein